MSDERSRKGTRELFGQATQNYAKVPVRFRVALACGSGIREGGERERMREREGEIEREGEGQRERERERKERERGGKARKKDTERKLFDTALIPTRSSRSATISIAQLTRLTRLFGERPVGEKFGHRLLGWQGTFVKQQQHDGGTQGVTQWNGLEEKNV